MEEAGKQGVELPGETAPGENLGGTRGPSGFEKLFPDVGRIRNHRNLLLAGCGNNRDLIQTGGLQIQ